MSDKKSKLPPKESIRLFRRILAYFSEYKWRISIAVVSMVVVAGCQAAVAYLIKPALDDIFINKDKTALLMLPFAFVLLFLVKGFFRYMQNYEMQYCGLKVLERVRNELHAKIICLPLSFFESNQVGNLMSRIVNDVGLIRTSLPSFVRLIREALTMVGLVGVVFWRDPFLATFAILVLPLALYPFVYFGRKLRQIGRKSQVKVGDITIVLQEVFSGIRVVKAFGTEKHEKKRFEDENGRLMNLAVKETIFNEFSSPVMELIGAVGIGLVVWYGGSQVIAGNSTPGTFFSFMTALVLLYDPVKSITSANMDIQRALSGAERVFEILDSGDISVEKSGGTEFVPPFRELRFDRVTMIYPDCPRPALDNISLNVRPGERVALVGPSGSGKTTFVNLIPRFYIPQTGTISVNGRPVEDYTLASLRRSIGMVSQDAFLFNMSVRENIAYGEINVSDEAIVEAARAAYAHDFILELPEGYDTIIGERGVKLSGGQKQRLTIARALLKNPPLLILDEATSALDTESERIVQSALDNLMRDRTSIVIAHRLSTVLSADRIVVMSGGRIEAVGAHAELLESSPLYAKLYNMQFQDAPQEDETGCVINTPAMEVC